MTRNAEFAVAAWQQGQRRRRTTAAIDRLADGVIAAGGFVLANAAGGLGMALPTGRVGLSIGAGAVCGGLAWVSRTRRARAAQRRIAHSTRIAPVLRRAA